MAEILELSAMRYYEEAKMMLEKKDLIEFISKISIAIEASRNDKEMLAKTTYLKANGLIAFNQYVKALDSIEEALKYNIGVEAFELKRNKGVAKGYLGKINEALKIFIELTHESNDIDFLVGVYINIAWVHLTLNKNDSDEHILVEVKHYLDLAKQHFDFLPDKHKWKLCNSYSVYYFYKREYEKAIEILENSIKYCADEDLPHIYNNLAELFIKSAETENGGVSEVAKEYLEKAEILGTKYNNNISLGYTFKFRAEVELREDQMFTALDTLYLSFEYFKEAEVHSQACDTLLKINEVMNKYKTNNLKSLRDNLNNEVNNISYNEKL